MQVEVLEGRKAYAIFKKIGENIYKGNPYYRGTESSVEKLLLDRSGAFSEHSIIKMFAITHNGEYVARFALIHDNKLLEYVQVSFFEAQKDLGDVFLLIKDCAKSHFSNIPKIVVGLNGHLNYGAGILLNRFNEAPMFGLPYNHEYYSDYFKTLRQRKMLSFRFGMDVYKAWAEAYKSYRKIEGLTLRFLDKKNMKRDSAIYTELNNKAFVEHPYWAERSNKEDLELLYPFRFLLDKENLIFAEINGKPVGFFLWYADFNELVSSQRDFNVLDVLKHRIKPSIKNFRFTEIGIIPEYQKSPVALALINKALPTLIKKAYENCEGGFIFEENKASMAFVKRILERCYGEKPEPYREFAVYETDI